MALDADDIVDEVVKCTPFVEKKRTANPDLKPGFGSGEDFSHTDSQLLVNSSRAFRFGNWDAPMRRGIGCGRRSGKRRSRRARLDSLALGLGFASLLVRLCVNVGHELD